MDAVSLTDDEVVAIAVRAGIAWPTMLPTVDVLEPEELAKAALRGDRSLVARGFMHRVGDGAVSLIPTVKDYINPILTRQPVLGVYVATEDLTYIPNGLTYVHYDTQTASEWVTDVITDGGIHHLSTTTGKEARETAMLLVQSAFENGLSGPQDDTHREVAAFLCFILSTLNGAIVLRAARNDLRLLELQSGAEFGGELKSVELQNGLDLLGQLKLARSGS